MSTESPNSIERTRPAKKRLPVRIARWLTYAFALFVALVLILLGITETKMFRDYLRDTLNREVSGALEVDFRISEINGNIFTGWRIDGIAMKDDAGPILDMKSLIIRYNPFLLPWKMIIVNELTLVEPRIYVTRAEGRDWNIARLLESKSEDTTSSPFDWTVRAENIRIIDGAFLRYDSTTVRSGGNARFDFSHLSIDSLNIGLSGFYSPRRKRISLDQFSFNNRMGAFEVKNISGDIRISGARTSVHSFSVETSRSKFQINVAAQPFNPTALPDTFDIFALPFKLSFEAPLVDVRDLQYFLPALDFLGSKYALRLAADGTLRDLDIQRLNLTAERTNIELTGRAGDIDKGASMYIEVHSENMTANGGDLPLVLPGIPLPDYSNVGDVRFTSLVFRGEPLKFHSEYRFESGAGAAEGYADMDITKEQLEYDIELKSKAIDLGKIFHSPALASSLTGHMTVSGAGVVPGRMNTTAVFTFDSSRFQRYAIGSLRGNVALGPSLLNAAIDLKGASGDVSMQSEMSFERDSVTQFAVRSDVSHLNIAAMFQDDELKSDLSFTFRANGNSIDIDKVTGKAVLAMQPSVFQETSFYDDTLVLTLDQRDPLKKMIRLGSTYADFDLDGQFDIPRFIEYQQVLMDSLAAGIRSLSIARAPDSVAEAPAPVVMQRSNATPVAGVMAGAIAGADSADFMNAAYKLTLREPERFAKYFGASIFRVRGGYEGKISGGLRGLDVSGELRVTDFDYYDSLRDWKAAGVVCKYDIRNLSPANTMGRLYSKLDLTIDDIAVNETHFSRISTSLLYENAHPSFSVRGNLDTTLSVALRGGASRDDTSYAVKLDQFAVNYLGQIWSNASPVLLHADTSRITIDRMRMRHRNAYLNLSGWRDFGGINNFSATLDSMPLGELEYVLTGNQQAAEGRSFTGTAIFEALLRGADDAPIISAALFIDSLGYRGSAIGTFEFEGTYGGGELEVYSVLEYLNADAKNKILFVSGTVPAEISFGAKEEKPGERSANLRFQLQEFPLALIEKFIGGMDELSGIVNADIGITGTTADPRYAGFLKVGDGRGRVLFNNMQYLFSLQIEPEERRFKINSLSVRNLESDWSKSGMEGTGYIDTKDLKLEGFDLTMKGALKVLSPESREKLKYMYGDLFVSTGQNPLRLKGRFDRSIFSGNINVQEGDLVFASDDQQQGETDFSKISYTVVDDVTKSKKTSLFNTGVRRKQAGNGEESTRNDNSFADGMSYDLTLSTAGRMRITMPFNSITKDELKANLTMQNFKVSNLGGVNKFTGEVLVAENSYYSFLGKKFAASGSLRFNADLENPDLNLRAVYSDMHTEKTGEQRRVFVILTITGTKLKPVTSFDLRYQTEDGPVVVRGGNVDSDALSFVMFGVFSDEMSSGEKGQLTKEVTESLGSSLGYTYASTFVTAALKGLGIDLIRSFELSQQGRTKISIDLLGFLVTYNGQFDTIQSSDFGVEFPLPMIGATVSVSRRGSDIGTSLLNEVYEGKLLFKYAW